MSILDVLEAYRQRPTSTEDDFDEVAQHVPSDALGQGVAHALRSDRTPDFGSMVGQLFGNSSPDQRAGLLNQLLRAAGPALLSSLGGGLLGKLRGKDRAVAPADASQVTPDQVRDIAAAAHQNDPGVLDRVGAFYGQHPQAVKALGGAALAIALGHIAQQMKR